MTQSNPDVRSHIVDSYAGTPAQISISIDIGDETRQVDSKVQQILLIKVLELVNGNKERAAKILGLSLKTVYNRLNAMSSAENSTTRSV